ncbi:GspE/PulE family protein [Niveibacterium terrae]|uniref:GspE/PulE family protein n=1 Tax=Niveibacterium terrae TaxID=3373598 RepID=UPI003A90CBF2
MNARNELALDPQALALARREATAQARPTLAVLHEKLGLDERELLRQLAASLHYRYFETPQILSSSPDFSAIPLAQALHHGCLPLYTELCRWVLFADPFDADLLDWLHARAPAARLALATDGDIRATLQRIESEMRALNATMSHTDRGESAGQSGEELSLVSIAEDSSPVVRLVNSTLYDALKSGASDIHFETTASGMEVKYRIDGVLDLATSVADNSVAEQAISRIKVLAELDIAERRVPQDGRFRVTVAGRSTDLRVSIMPSIHGEDAVLRILDKRQLVPSGGRLTLDLLGFETGDLETIRRLADEPYGMLLVTGPTGSGKTTTLYGAISETWTGRDKIITIEDPVEYELAGVLQIPVNEKKGLSFARGLRSILRHDPDKIMVGEIRDAETAEIAVQSALTGHLVLSTVHANSVFDVFSRFAHMGVDPHALASALNGIWAQRLLRTVCPNCATAIEADATQRKRLGLTDAMLDGARLVLGRGCGDCRGTGYRGRRAIAEILLMTDPLRELITEQASIVRIKEAARRAGTRSLRDAALALALRGETTIEEVLRVTLQ